MRSLVPLSLRFTALAADLPGYGASPPTAAALTDDFYLRFVEELIGRFALGPVVLVAHSLGGFVAFEAARAGASGIRGLLLVDAAGFGAVQLWQLRLLSVPGVGEFLLRLPRDWATRQFISGLIWNQAALSDEVMAWARGSLGSPRSQNEFLRQLRLGLQWGRTRPEFIRRVPVHLGMPVRILWGAHDPVFPVGTARIAQRLIGCEEPLIFHESGHIPQLEQTGQFNAAVEAFALEVYRGASRL